MIFSETPLFLDLQKYFGKDTSFMFGGKLRCGKFILFGSKNSFFNINIENRKGIHTYEFPYPYSYKCEKNYIYLDYRLKTLIKEDIELWNLILKFKTKCKAKENQFWDKEIYIYFPSEDLELETSSKVVRLEAYEKTT